MVEALNHYDEDGLIFEVFKNEDIRDYLKQPFEYNSYFKSWELISRQFEPKLQLNHALPERLKLLPIEEEVFYILHFACYAIEQLTWPYYCGLIIIDWGLAIFDLGLGEINGQQAAQVIKENLCEKVLNCTAINIVSTKDIPIWKDCHRNYTNPMHQNWCKNCVNLSECLEYGDYFLHFIVNTFYTWRKYHNKRNVIDASISTYLYREDCLVLSDLYKLGLAISEDAK